jgi:hypothetical protein
MFQLYTNLLAVDAKYAWNMIIQEQTQSDPYTDLQGVSRKGPRGYSHKSLRYHARRRYTIEVLRRRIKQ